MNRFTNINNHVEPSTRAENALSLELIAECKSTTTLIKKNLRDRLENLNRETRKKIVSYMKDGCAPLFVACKRGNVELVEYLSTVCDAPLEQRGQYEVSEDRSTHTVTPLWCSAVAGNLPVVKCLVRLGANINALSDTGSTPVRSACFMTNIDVVKYLCENGADIRRPNQNGGTCLINSVQSVELCKYLISKDIDVNAKDIQHKTALHYAIQEHHLETVQLLLENGADPFAKSRYGDDALQTACLKAAHNIFHYLKSRIDYSPDRLAESHELIGSTFLDEHNETRVCILHWRVATHIRHQHATNGHVEKLPKIPQRAAYLNQQEFTTLEELEELATDVDAMRIQSVMICERILGIQHKDTLFRLMFRGASYADSLQFQRCIDFWLLVLQVRVDIHTILYSDTCFTAQAIVRLMLDLIERNLEVVPYDMNLPRFTDVFSMFVMLTQDIEQAKALLQVRPIYKKQQENFDRILKCLTHLLYLLLQTARTPEQNDAVMQSVAKIVKNTRSSCNDTLLHLVVSRLNVIKSTYFTDEPNVRSIFPNIDVVRLLLRCGAEVNATNKSKSTPLLIACAPYNFDSELVHAILDSGGHIDCPNCPITEEKPITPLYLIKKNPNNPIHFLNYLSLTCLSATIIAKFKIPYKNQIPKSLEAFVKLHESS